MVNVMCPLLVFLGPCRLRPGGFVRVLLLAEYLRQTGWCWRRDKLGLRRWFLQTGLRSRSLQVVSSERWVLDRLLQRVDIHIVIDLQRRCQQGIDLLKG